MLQVINKYHEYMFLGSDASTAYDCSKSLVQFSLVVTDMVGILETKYSSKVRRKVMSGLSCRKYLRSFFSVSIILIPSHVYDSFSCVRTR